MTAEQSPRAAHVTVARVLRPHGVRGEVASEILTDFPERLTRLKSAELWNEKTGAARSVVIRKCWLSHSRGGQAIFHFEDSASVGDAKKLIGLEVQIPLAERAALPYGSYYVTDLIGCEVFEKNRTRVGSVRDVQFTGEGPARNPILVVDSAHGELLIPLAQEICERVDVHARRIEVVLPDGLHDLNSE
ncbi:MAG: ribosome maturation factor RimM [Candidatus Acidiferrales bacterium]